MTFKDFASKEAASKRVLLPNDSPAEKAGVKSTVAQPAAQPEKLPDGVAPAAKP